MNKFLVDAIYHLSIAAHLLRDRSSRSYSEANKILWVKWEKRQEARGHVTRCPHAADARITHTIADLAII